MAWGISGNIKGPQGIQGPQGNSGGAADVASVTDAATSKTTPVNADELPLVDSAASFSLKKLTWANLVAAVKSYYDSVASTLTNKNLTSGTNVFPTLNQSTTGNAATATKLATPRTINGASFDGSANITITPRSGTVASSATPSINTDTIDVYTITALAVNITSFTTSLSGTPTVTQKLMIGIKDNGTSRTITWGTSFVSTGVATLLAATAAGKQHWIGLQWDGTYWACLAVDATGY